MSSSSVFFFTGDNEFLLSEELRRWKKEFAAKHGDENLLVLDGKKQKFVDLMDAVSALPFIAEKRLVVIDGIPKFSKEEMQHVLDACHDQTIVVFAEASPDKRLSATKILEKNTTVKKFAAFSSKTLAQWIQEEAGKRGLRLTPGATDRLQGLVGASPRMIAIELEKFALAIGQGTVTEEHVQLFTPPSGERVVWGLTNLLGEKRIPQALTFLWDYVDRGENPYGLWTILLDMTRKIVAVWAAADAGHAPARIASDLKMHPFAVRGLLPLARSLSENDVRRLCSFMTASDIALKTGGYRYSVDAPEEVIALTERAILACA